MISMIGCFKSLIRVFLILTFDDFNDLVSKTKNFHNLNLISYDLK